MWPLDDGFNATTNQKHASTMEGGYYMMHNHQEGTLGECDHIYFGVIKLGRG